MIPLIQTTLYWNISPVNRREVSLVVFGSVLYFFNLLTSVDTGAFRCDSDGFFVNNSLAAGDRHTSAFTSLLMGIPWKLEQSLHLQNKRPMCIGCPLCCMLFDLFRSAMKRQPAGGFFDQWRLCLIFKKISRLIINTSNYSNSWCTSSVYITILSDSLFRQFILGVQVEINCQVKFVCCCYRREWITTNLPKD